MNLDFLLRCKRNYAIRTILSLDHLGMPAHHEDDGEVAQFCMNWNLGLLKTENVPVPRSITALTYLASL